MTPEEKIAGLVEHIKKEFPNGCESMTGCVNCPINNPKWGSIESVVCDLLSYINAHAEYNELLPEFADGDK